MRIYGVLCVLIVLAMVLTPILALDSIPNAGESTGTSSGAATQKNEAATENKEEENQDESKDKDTIRVLSVSSGKVEVIDEREYVCGAVAAEMPATYHPEALKAQAAACYTYALRMKYEQEQAPDAKLKGAYITDESTTHQGYLNIAQRKAKWGDKFEVYSEKIEKAVDEVIGKVITFDGQPIIAAFHAISTGKTEDAKTVWGEDIPYLKPVLSAGDRLSPDYTATVIFSQDQFKKKAESLEGVQFDDDASGWVGKNKVSDAGTVISIEIGGKAFTGAQVRTAFNLRSPAFKIDYKDKSFTVHVTGYGHSVGMSQYGADFMARQGSTWEEIIEHYYTGVSISLNA